MANIERSSAPNENDVIEILALFLAGRIKREDMSPDNQNVLSFYLGLMAEDRQFAKLVNERKNQILTEEKNGRKIPLFSPEQIERMKKPKRRRKKPEQSARQLEFWPVQAEISPPIDYRDPEKKIHQLGQVLDSKYYPQIKNTPISDEMRKKRQQLREMVGLPVARGKDPHVNDPNYKFLVSQVYRYDGFGIFREYDRIYTEIPGSLQAKIDDVTEIVSSLISLSGRQLYGEFNRLHTAYWERWKDIH